MKKRNLLLWFACLALIFVGCSEDDSPDYTPPSAVSEEELDIVIAQYVDGVVIPTYEIMLEKVTALDEIVRRFQTTRSQADLDAACDAWRAAREPWEQSEAFLFGPAEYENLDPSLDEWPLDEVKINELLESGDFKDIEDEDGEDEDDEIFSIRGFHTIEYLMFDTDINRTRDSKDVSEITDNMASYMVSVSKRLVKDTETLHKAWTEGLGQGTQVVNSYGDEFKNHNTTRLSSAVQSMEEIIDGMDDIANEVMSQKIGIPYSMYKAGDHEEALWQVESWCSWNSLDDYYNNMVSIENSYLGGRPELRKDAASLSYLVRSLDEDLDTRVKAAITNAKNAIRDIPAPFRSNLDKSTEIEAAQEACSEISRVLIAVRTALEL